MRYKIYYSNHYNEPFMILPLKMTTLLLDLDPDVVGDWMHSEEEIIWWPENESQNEIEDHLEVEGMCLADVPVLLDTDDINQLEIFYPEIAKQIKSITGVDKLT